MIRDHEPCPSCGTPCLLKPYPHTIRREKKSVSLNWHHHVCTSGCRSERDGQPLSFVTAEVSERDRGVAERAWQAKYNESLPPAGRPGRPHRVDGPSSERVPVRFTPDELEEIDRRRGDMSRSAYVRQAALGHR